jgi:transcriptional regulator with XRE-family HTH domain
MRAEPSPTTRRRQLGRKLRRLREEAGKKPEEVAAYAGVQRNSITRIEAGRQAILPKNVRLMCQFYGVGAPLMDHLIQLAEASGEKGWWTVYSDILPDWFEDYVGMEADAEEIQSYETLWIPGPAQDKEYIEALARARQTFDPELDVEKFVRFRVERQNHLWGGPRLDFVVNEAAFRIVVGGHDVMAKQIAYIRRAIEQGHVRLQLLEFSSGGHAALANPFSMLRFPAELEMNTVYLEHDRGASYLERPKDLEYYGRLYATISKAALSEETSFVRLASLEAEHIRANERGAG